MNGATIKKLLTEQWPAKYIFRGVYPSDRLPKHVPEGMAHAFVINTDTHTKPGEHWVAVYVSPFAKATYFDSFGMVPFPKAIDTFIRDNGWRLQTNPITLQSFTAATCGLYCVLFIEHMCKGGKLRDFLQRFNPLCPLTNDRKIQAIFHNRL